MCMATTFLQLTAYIHMHVYGLNFCSIHPHSYKTNTLPLHTRVGMNIRTNAVVPGNDGVCYEFVWCYQGVVESLVVRPFLCTRFIQKQRP